MIAGKNSIKAISKMIDFRKSPEYIAEVKIIVNGEFKKLKNELILKFNNHPITKEIDAGPRASNTSGTLGGYGNLFSFIGFDASQKPTNPIRELLNNTFITNVTVQKDGGANVFVYYPSARDIFEVTPMPWAEGRSWAEGIERGLSGFGLYLNKDDENSRSGAGIQTSSSNKKGKFQNTKYISHLIDWFEREIIKLNKMKF